MGHRISHTCAFLLIALTMFATAKPLAHGLIPGLNVPVPVPIPISDIPRTLLNSVFSLVNGLNVSGVLCCTPTGNCVLGSQPLAGMRVLLNCPLRSTGVSTVVGEAITIANGSFNINVRAIIALNIDPLRCNVTVPLQPDRLLNCPALSSLVNNTVNQALTAVVTPLSLLFDLLRGVILNLSVGLFVFATL